MTQRQRKVFIHSDELDCGGYPNSSPFNTRRAGRTLQMCRSMGLLSGHDREVLPPLALTRPELERFHSSNYLDALHRAGHGDLDHQGFMMGLGTGDCPVFKGLLEFASLAAGATVTGARLILDGKAHIAFNPSGGFHHAHPDRAAGFCFVNDIVLATQVLADAGKRVLVVDIDVHHCDGVQDAFYDRGDVMVVSLHQSGRTLFPGTGFEDEIGVGPGKGYNVNIPLPVGTYDEIYHRAFMDTAWPLIQAFDPDVLILEMGMDALAGDPLAHLHLTNNVYVDVVETITSLNKPILATGGGGYHVENTIRGWTLLWSVLCGEDSQAEDLSFGMGGVMLENTDWIGGLRDRVLLADGGRRGAIDAEIRVVTDRIRSTIFPLHRL
jgi:acetoin utilization protein AcuC